MTDPTTDPDAADEQLSTDMAPETAANRYAEILDPGADDGIGVRTDTLMDAMLAARDAYDRWQDVYLTMDAFADDPEVVPAAVMPDVSGIHATAGYYVVFYETLADELRSRFEASQDAERREVARQSERGGDA